MPADRKPDPPKVEEIVAVPVGGNVTTPPPQEPTPPLDTTVAGGKFIVNGVTVNANGEKIGA